MSDTKLEKWVNHLSQSELPIFKYSLIAITTITARDDTSSNELAGAILKDINLTARILRLSNSYIYNPSNTKINTITSAVMLLGFDLVRDISISLAIIDVLLKGNKENHIMKLMARTFHAAVQARAIAEVCGDESAEEIFIAALLRNIGELTFFCIDSQSSEKLINSRLLATDENYEKIQTDIIGFTFNELSAKLTQDWQLSDLLRETLDRHIKPSQRSKHISLGNAIAAAAEQGWQNAETTLQLTNLAKHLNKDLKEITQFVHTNVEMAVQVAREFGARDVVKFIPSLKKAYQDYSAPIELEEQDEYLIPDHMLQLSILRELSNLINQSPTLTTVLTMVLEGIYRGIGMDRAALVFFNPEKTEARAKIAVGMQSQEFQNAFVFNVDINSPNILQQMLLKKRSFWIQNNDTDQQLVGKNMRNTLNVKEFFSSPISIATKTIGFFYADREPSGRRLDDESYGSFKHFTQEACIALRFISQK